MPPFTFTDFGFLLTVIKIKLPCRFNWRYFYVNKIGRRIGIVFGVSGKCCWLYFIDATSEEYQNEKEDVDSWYEIRKRLK